jgi:ribosomal-protein-alanine N-acetyltransferase
MSIILETHRLVMRELVDADVDALAAVYADPETMRFFNGPRSRDAAARQIEVCRRAYARGGFAFLATIHRADDAFIGRCGLLPQLVEGADELEVAYMIARPYWNNGLGTEAARALRDYAFRVTAFPRVVSIIAPENHASIRVAEKNGMRYVREVLFEGDMDRLYAVDRPEGVQ